MFAALLIAAAAGQVVEPGLVRVWERVSPGDTLAVRRLEPAPGAPGRAPFFVWAKSGRVRVTAVRPDGTAEVALVRGKMAPGDRVMAD